MADRFLPADDPVLEEVLNWTVTRDLRISGVSWNGFHWHVRLKKGVLY